MIGWLYDLCGRVGERKGLADRRRALLAPLEGEVVEIGAGTGLNLAHYERAARVVAVEPDASMARRLRRRAAEARVPVDVVDASAERLPFPDASFDHAVATLVLCSVSDPAAALAELRRVLRPDGSFVFLEHVRGDRRLARWQDRVAPVHVRVFGCHPNRDTAVEIERAGFRLERLERTTLPAAHPLVRPAIHGVATNTSS